MLKKIYNLACSYPLFEVFWPGGTRISTASLKISFRSSAVAEKGRFFTNSVRASFSVGHMSVSASTGTKLFSIHKEMFQFMTSITFFGVLRAFFAAGLFQFHFLAHDLFTIELQALLQVLLRCKVHIAKFPVELKMQATSDMPPSMNLSVTDQLLFLTLQIKQGRCHASYNDKIL